MLPNSSRTYHDPLHGAITLDSSDPVEALLIRLIDTPIFQRLRRIRQLGLANLTFHGAESSRFTHSLGVMAIARRVFDRLAKRYPLLQPHRSVLLGAALLHDIGHGPFSHTSEEIFGNDHELWTRRLLTETTEIYALLTGLDPRLPAQISAVYTQQYPVPLIWQLISSQLDCDRLDYLMRDAYFTGASYGHLDLDRILLALDYDPVQQQLIVNYKGMAAIEHYLIVRHLMYAQVYHHPKNIAASWLLEQAFKRARSQLALQPLEADPTVVAWLTQPGNALSLTDYLAADDIVFHYHLQRWQQSSDPVLADLCRRLVNRDLLKVLNVSDWPSDRQHQVLEQIDAQLSAHGWVPQMYAGLYTAQSRGYTLYRKGIKLNNAGSLVEISECSPLVKTLARSSQQVWLLYPPDLDEWIRTIAHRSG